jgi:hypothetical protein
VARLACDAVMDYESGRGFRDLLDGSFRDFHARRDAEAWFDRAYAEVADMLCAELEAVPEARMR